MEVVSGQLLVSVSVSAVGNLVNVTKSRDGERLVCELLALATSGFHYFLLNLMATVRFP